MYLKWNTKTISDFSDENINSLYREGYLFGRTDKGEMYQTRSLRIILEKFSLSSENKRILRKTEEIKMKICHIPYDKYHWSIGKLAKDFYNIKFGTGTFSANKMKELMTDKKKGNFNVVFKYSLIQKQNCHPELVSKYNLQNLTNEILNQVQDDNSELVLGYCIALKTNEIIHYCYPFYHLEASPKNMGLGMMLKTILWAKENNKKYIYLGSFSRPTDTYKLQFEGLEWFDGEKWSTDIIKLKNLS